jgi:hypothetical protein
MVDLNELRGGPSGTFELGGALFEFMTTVRQEPTLLAMWVRGLHWPGCCECEGTHVSISFGEGHSYGQFRVANLDFWTASGVQMHLVRTELDRWLALGELPDWVSDPRKPLP